MPMATNICMVVLEVHVKDVTAFSLVEDEFCFRSNKSTYFHLRN